jgi:hypothetical protein
MMKLWKVVLIVMLTIGCSAVLFETPVAAEQGAAKETEESHGSHAGMACCLKKGEQGNGMACCQKKGKQGEEKSCCEDHEGSHGAGHERSHGEKGAH